MRPEGKILFDDSLTTHPVVVEAKRSQKQLQEQKREAAIARANRPLLNKHTYAWLYEKWKANGGGRIPKCNRCREATLFWNEPAHVCEGYKPQFVEHDEAWHEKQEAKREAIRESNQDRPNKCIVCHEVIRDLDDARYHEQYCCEDLPRGKHWYTDYDPIIGDNDGHECNEDEPEYDYCEGDDDGYDCEDDGDPMWD